MNTRTKEAVRYLGYGGHAVDDCTLALVDSSFEELHQAAEKRIIYRIFELTQETDDQIEIEGLHISSRDLGKNLKGCGEVVLLGATLGAGVDRLLRKYTISDMARVVVLQACAAAMLEEYLDEWQEMLCIDMKKQGLYLRPRFSPGYGDFSIGHQEMILRMLDASKRIGLTMTEGSMLVPSKSVTAVIGISQVDAACHRKGCEVCKKKDCMYRRCG